MTDSAADKLLTTPADLDPFARDVCRVDEATWRRVHADPDNVASRRVIEVNGGVLVERFQRPAQYGGTDALRFRIDFSSQRAVCSLSKMP